MALSKFEKRLSIIALVFVAVYLGAAALTIHSRITKEDKIERLESEELTPGERQLMLAELFLPMLILLALTVCFIIVRKQRSKKYLKLDESEDEFQ
jgi:NADH:ubiquinone oxidoreductase subunit 6 (subunit J)